MARILGISAHYHDAAAALVVGGEVVAAIQEERLSRVKNDPNLPLRAARACLALGGLRSADLDEVVFYEEPFERVERVLVGGLRQFPAGALGLPQMLRAQWTDKVWVLDALSESLGVPRHRVTTRQHHVSHAASAFFLSPFERAAVLTVDGVGENTTTGLFYGEGERLEFLERLEFPHSLGLLYAAFTAYLGFEVNDGEHQVMGLSAYGTPRYLDKLAKIVRCHDDGSFELRADFFDLSGDAGALYSAAVERMLGPPRPYRRQFGPYADGRFEDPESQRFADVAASLQVTLERALLGLARRLRAKTRAQNLCLAGGVALNAVANARLSREAGFDDLFVQPASGDAGGALGAAVLGALERGDPRPTPMTSVSWGEPMRVERAEALATEMGLQVRRLETPAAVIAERLAQGQLLAFAQGRGEWGPRALGNRSILGRTDSKELRDRLNRVVKRREDFRPFAPAVLEVDAPRYFEACPSSLTPFMTTVCRVKPEGLRVMLGTTHVDGTARVQTVREGNPLFAILLELKKLGLPAALLNTSLNGPGEPIAWSEGDVLAFFGSSELDALVLENLLIERTTP